MRALLSFYKKRKQATSDLSLNNCLDAARATAANTKYCFLITAGLNGWANARLVEPICDLHNFVFFVGTNPAFRKIKEISANPKVTLAFGNARENANLIIYGSATVSAEPAIKQRYWKGAWRMFFPNGPNGNDYAVIRVEVEKMELLSFRRNVIPEPFGLRPIVLRKVNETWSIEI